MGRKIAENDLFRRLSVFDQDIFRQHLLRLDEDGRRLRFGMIASDEFLTEYAKGCSRWDVIIYGYFVDGEMRGAAELRPLDAWGKREAEAAFSVEKKWRGRGVGAGLFERLLRSGRNRGFRKIYMSCLATNRPMQSLAHKFKADVTFDQGGTMGVIDPGAQNVGSMMGEAAEEASAYAFATIDVPRMAMLSNPLRWFAPR